MHARARKLLLVHLARAHAASSLIALAAWRCCVPLSCRCRIQLIIVVLACCTAALLCRGPQLEVTLGRIAMIGFVGLILNEAYFQRPFFPHVF